MVDENLFEKLATRIKNFRSEFIELERLLTSIPALGPINGGKGEWPKAKALRQSLENAGFGKPEEYNALDPSVPEGTRPNLVFRLPGKKKAPTIWFLTHMDVVPPGEGWNQDPFTLKVEADRVIGRGVEDNQQGLVATVMATRAFVNEKITPEFPVALAFVSDEETGSKFGVQYLLDNHKLFAPEDIIVVPDAGLPDGTMIEVAEKSILWLRVDTNGQQCHASTPYLGKNALLAAAKLMTKVEEVRKKYGQKDPIFDPPHSTFEPTKKPFNGIDNVNTIPGKDTFFLDCRILPSYNSLEVLEFVKQKAREVEAEMAGGGYYSNTPVKIEVSIFHHEPSAPPTSADAPEVGALKEAIKKVYNVEGRPMGIGGGTVAALLRRKGYKAVVWSKMDELAHQPNEYAKIDNLIGDAQVFAYLCLKPSW